MDSPKGGLLFLLLLFALAHFTNHTSTTVLSPDSVDAQALLPSPAITTTQDGYRLTYPLLNITASEAADRFENATMGNPRYWSHAARYERQEACFDAEHETVLKDIMDVMASVDVPAPGSRIIHGRLTDEFGTPLANTQVDLMGDYLIINFCKTRRDGTFTLVLHNTICDPNLSSRLRFRTSNPNRVFYSGPLTLSLANPVAYIEASRNIVERYRLLWVLAPALTLAVATRNLRRWSRHTRHRPGMCVNCGYDLRGAVSDRCSECGTPIPQQTPM